MNIYKKVGIHTDTPRGAVYAGLLIISTAMITGMALGFLTIYLLNNSSLPKAVITTWLAITTIYIIVTIAGTAAVWIDGMRLLYEITDDNIEEERQ